jgi:polyisoprenoid-binding protein YceI
MSLRFLACLPLLFAVACQSEIDNKPAAEVAPAPVAPVAAPEPAPEAAADVTPYAFDGTASTLGFIAGKVTKDHPGGFKTFSGTAKIAGTALTEVTAEIELGSVFSDAPKLTGHLQSPDFFDVGTFPKATFTSSAVAVGADGVTTVTGTLDLHGVKKELSFPVTVAQTEGGQKVTGEFTLNRQDFGIAYPGKPDDLVKDNVLIKLDVNLTPLAG